MAKVKVLIQGCTSADSIKGEETRPTIVLVQDKSLNIVVDPGVLKDQQILVDALKKEGLEIGDINMVFITHSHIDHYRNIGMFPKAKTLEYWGLWDGGAVEKWSEQFTDDIRVIKTPGHSSDSLTFLVNADEGVVAIVGDVFWKENSPDKDPYASDPEKLKVSRAQVIELADYIIPGHGDIYKVEK